MYPTKTIKINKKNFGSEQLAVIYAGSYTLQQWDWERKNTATSKSTKIDLLAMIPSVDVGLMNIETLAACLVKAPFETSLNSPNYDMIKKLPGWLGDQLLRIARELNKEITVDRKKNS